MDSYTSKLLDELRVRTRQSILIELLVYVRDGFHASLVTPSLEDL